MATTKKIDKKAAKKAAGKTKKSKSSAKQAARKSTSKQVLSAGKTREDSLLQLRLTVLEHVVGVLASHFAYRSVLYRMLSLVRDLIQADAGTVMLLDPKSNGLVFEVVQGRVAPQLQNYRLSVGEGIAGWVAEQGKPVMVPKVAKDPRFSPVVYERTQYEARNMVCVPIFSGGSTVGVLQLLNHDDDRPFNKDDLQVAEVIADAMGNILGAVVGGNLDGGA